MQFTRPFIAALSLLAAGCASRVQPTPAMHAAATPAIVAPTPAAPTPAAPAEPRPGRPLANLQILAHHAEDPQLYWSFGDEMPMVSMTAAAAQQLGATRHIRLTTQLRHHRPWLWHGDIVLLLLRNGEHKRVVAVDPRTLAERWHVDTDSMLEVTDRLLIAERPGEGLTALALDSGREVWRTPKQDLSVDDLWTDGARVLVFDGAFLHAFDADSGAPRWGPLAVDGACGWTADTGVIVVEAKDGYRVLDTASGATLRTLGGPGLCRWNHDYGPGFVGGVLGGGALVVVEPRVTVEGERVAPTVLRSYDLTTGAERWTRPRDDLYLAVAHGDAVYAKQGHEWHALDAASGATMARISLPDAWAHRAHSPNISSEHSASGPLVFLNSTSGTWVLGRGPEPRPPETYEIRGRIREDPRLDRSLLRDLPIDVAGQVVRTDATGRFIARGAAVGQLPVALADQNPLAQHRWGARPARVLLDGSGTYTVALELHEWDRGGGGGIGLWLPPVGPRRTKW